MRISDLQLLGNVWGLLWALFRPWIVSDPKWIHIKYDDHLRGDCWAWSSTVCILIYIKLDLAIVKYVQNQNTYPTPCICNIHNLESRASWILHILCTLPILFFIAPGETRWTRKNLPHRRSHQLASSAKRKPLRCLGPQGVSQARFFQWFRWSRSGAARLDGRLTDLHRSGLACHRFTCNSCWWLW